MLAAEAEGNCITTVNHCSIEKWQDKQWEIIWYAWLCFDSIETAVRIVHTDSNMNKVVLGDSQDVHIGLVCKVVVRLHPAHSAEV